MEFELVSEDVVGVEEYSFGADDVDNDSPTIEGERCGICMDIVIDRGVLDCCQHWFCFACIDNWASITNLCPLCQNEFQLITCIPVYDTIGSSQSDEDSFSRDDDWCIEGKNSTLSFPSYYIDENAVVCLEGDSCKIRSRSATVEEDPDLDTSIACDSCDLWYHAFCVGFDPDGNCENSWLCPRCLLEETSKKLEGASAVGQSKEHGPQQSGHECVVEATFPRKVSVSVADVGETAVVVSLVEGTQEAEIPSDVLEFPSGAGSGTLETVSQMSVPVTHAEGTALLVLMSEESQTNEKRSRDSMKSLDVCDCMENGMLQKLDDVNCKLRKPLGEKICRKPKIEPLLDHSNRGSDETSNKHLVKDESAREVHQKKGSIVCCLPANRTLHHIKENALGVTGAKRKYRNYSAENEESKVRRQNYILAKKSKVEQSSQLFQSVNEDDETVTDGLENSTSPEASSEDGSLGSILEKQNTAPDIRDIVRGTLRPTKRISSKEKEHAAGLRVKKIMRRVNEDKESVMVVQKLRKEIRDAIRNRSSNEVGDNLFDPKLLAAFRAAVAGQTAETKRPLPLDLKAKKSLLQKGTVRENLTKKIYGIGGKRKRAWTRECEVEFWKHRCLKVTKPEKISTLKSVLNLLRKSPEITEIKQENESLNRSSILSRLYLADASVFPRKDDIKPLSALKATGFPEKEKEHTSTEKASTLIDSSAKPPQTSEVSAKLGDPLSHNKQSTCIFPGIKSESNNSKVYRNKGPEVSSKSKSVSSPIKIHKRKWALEVLARKTADSSPNAAHGQEDKAILKGNYPLLAQLPIDMRPVLSPSRHNKIPISIRQAQLYRLTEHFLKKTNLPVTRRTAEIELTIADAVNVEKDVADRSNSKLVYVNLCSQQLLHRQDNTISTELSDTQHAAGPDDRSENVTKDLSSGAEVDEALRNAGLLSDSPPNSPNHLMEENEEGYPSKKTKDEGPDNIFEIDYQPELDIYGDFEYDLEDDDFLGASALKISKLQHDEAKLRMVFSTLDSDRQDGVWNSGDCGAPIPAKEKSVDTMIDNRVSDNSLPEGGERQMLDECEQLYGPDKEPLFNTYPETALMKPFELEPDNLGSRGNEDGVSKLEAKASEQQTESCSENLGVRADNLPSKPQQTVKVNEIKESKDTKEKKCHVDSKESDRRVSVSKKVEAYVKEHIRPLCKSGVITVEQYRWAVGKTTDKIMKYHAKDTNANFLIKEGDRVKKLAEQYIEAAQKEGKMK